MGRPSRHVKAWFVRYKDQVYALDAAGDLVKQPSERFMERRSLESKATQTYDDDYDGFLLGEFGLYDFAVADV